MERTGRRGGVGAGSGRALVQAGIACLVVAGCATDPPPALLTVVDVEALAIQDSRLLPESTKVAVRSYLGRVRDQVWSEGLNPEIESLIAAGRGATALLDVDVLPRVGRTASVVVDVPGAGPHEFRITHVATRESGRETYTGQAKDEPIAILIVRDSVAAGAAGRITTSAGVFNFRSARFGLVSIAPLDTSGTLPELHLIGATVAPDVATDEPCTFRFSPSHLDRVERC